MAVTGTSAVPPAINKQKVKKKGFLPREKTLKWGRKDEQKYQKEMKKIKRSGV